METAELILIKSDLSNNIGWVLKEPGDKESFRELGRKTFVIPEGFKFGTTYEGDIAFFDKDGHFSEVCTNQKTKTPFLWDANGCNYFQSADLVFSTTKDLRRAVGFTQKEMAEYFEIPLKTIQNWEIGRTNPPDYLVKLIEYKLRNEGILTGEVEENQE